MPDEDSEEAAIGTLLHNFDANPSLDRSTLKPAQQDLLKISSDLDDFVFARVSEQFGVEPNEPFLEGNEKELRALEGTLEETPGHCDRWRYYAGGWKLLVIIDKKFGYKETTPAAANFQLRTYAIAGAEEWDTDRIVVAITQPRLSYDRRVTMASYEVEDLEASEKELHSIRVNSTKPDAPLVAGEDQCRYCKAKLICGAYKAKFTSIQQYSSMALDKCTDGQLDEILVAIQFADFIKEQARDEARRRVEAGQLTNWTLGKASEMRTVADSKRAISLLALRGVITRGDALECSSLKLGKLEEKIREKTKCTWPEAKKIVDETIGTVIDREKKKPSLTRVK